MLEYLACTLHVDVTSYIAQQLYTIYVLNKILDLKKGVQELYKEVFLVPACKAAFNVAVV